MDGGGGGGGVGRLARAGAAVAEEAPVRGAGVAGQGLDGADAGAGEAAGDVALQVEVEVPGPRGGAEEIGIARVLLQEGRRELRPHLVRALADCRPDAGADALGLRAQRSHGGDGGLVPAGTGALPGGRTGRASGGGRVGRYG